jgi:hypothetical protein
MTTTRHKCQLCRTNPADQTGSHILTAWLVASMFDKEKRNRDYEVMYEIAPFDSSIPFIGRNVSPDTVEEQLGRALTDEEIQNQENKVVKDHFLCTNCEKRFKAIEDEYLTKVHNILEKVENEKLIDFESEHSYIIRLFFLSQIWRISASKNFPFSFEQKFEERIRDLLNTTLDIKINKILENATIHSDALLSIPLCIIKSTKDFKPTSKPLMVNPLLDKPYFLILNDYVLLIYEKESHTRSTPHDFYGISKFMKKDWINRGEKKFKFGYLNNKQWTSVTEKFVIAVRNQRIKNLTTLFIMMHQHKYHTKPTQESIKIFLKSALSNDLSVGVKYLKANLLKAMNDALVTKHSG